LTDVPPRDEIVIRAVLRDSGCVAMFLAGFGLRRRDERAMQALTA